jgi:hypothetical protein
MGSLRRVFIMVANHSIRVSRRIVTSALALGVLVCSAPVFAQTVHRSIDEFIAAQGTFCVDDGAGGCVLFVPPVQNFVGWTDTKNFLGASVDYAGLADDAAGGILGTTFSGTVSERTLQDGRVVIKVNLRTENALTWIVPFDPTSTENQFRDNELLFGVRTADVIDGAVPSLGTSRLVLEFTNPAPGLPLPDFNQLLFAPEPGQELLSVHFEAHADGTFPDGSTGKVHVIEKGIFDNGFHGAVGDGFPVELINLIRD